MQRANLATRLGGVDVMSQDCQPSAVEGVPAALSEVTRSLTAHPQVAKAAIERSLDQLAHKGIELPYSADRLPLTPALLPSSWAPRLEVGCQAMFAGIEAIFAGAFQGDSGRLADYLLFSPEERSLLMIDTGQYDWAGVARPDFMVSDGKPLLIESNITTSVGLLEAGLLGDVLLAIPSVRDLVNRLGLTTIDPARILADTIARSCSSASGRAIVVLADWADELRIWLYLYRHLAILLAERGILALPFALEDLDVRTDGVYADGRRADLLYRFYTTTRLPQASFAALHEPLFAAIGSGKVRLFGDYRHKLFSPKLFLALLSDEQFADCLPAAQAAELRKIVPWTRIVEDRATLCCGERVDLLDFAATNREGLVLKPNFGYGGKDVTVGSDVSQSDWEARLSAAMKAPEHWLVQEKIPTPLMSLAFLIEDEVQVRPAKVDYGAFMIDRAFAGAARRNSTHMTGPTLTNLSRGGGLSPVFFYAGADGR